MSDAAVIGANGYIGRHVARALHERGCSLTLLGRGGTIVAGVGEYHDVDLRDVESLPRGALGADHLFFFVGRTGVTIGADANRELTEGNEICLLNFLEFHRREELSGKVIYPSTRLVYKGNEKAPLREEDEKDPRSVYAVSKYACEKHLRNYHRSYRIPYVVLRICVPYGNTVTGPSPYGTVSHFMAKAMGGEDLIVYGDGEQRRSFIHIQDLSRIVVDAAFSENVANDVFNIGGPDTLSIREVAEGIARRFGVRVKTVPWPRAARAAESGDTHFDSSKLSQRVDCRYEFNFWSWLQSPH